MIPPYRSPALKRWGAAQAGFGWFNMTVGALFWGFAKWVDHMVMPAEVYGDIVTGIPAETWAWSIMSAQFLLLLGVIINGAWRWSPILRCLGSFASIGIFGSFTYSAAIGGEVFFVLCCGVMALTYVTLFMLNFYDLVVAANEPR